MKLPNYIIISSVTYKVLFNPEMRGGESDLSTKVITVGTANKPEIKNILYHEALESILHERGMRYTRYEEGNDGIRFVMSHHDFENFVADVLVVVEALKSFKI